MTFSPIAVGLIKCLKRDIASYPKNVFQPVRSIGKDLKGKTGPL